MTRDEIINMPAGREMDVLVAEKVFGWTDIEKKPLYDEPDFFGISPELASDLTMEYVPNYSKYIQDAWKVVEKIGEKENAQLYLCTNFSSEFGNKFYVEIFINWDGEVEKIVTSATAETVPLAICRVALFAALAMVVGR